MKTKMQGLSNNLLYFLKPVKIHLIFNKKYVKISGRKSFVRKGVLMHDYIKGAQLPSVISLAYLGDAVYSLYIRKMLIDPMRFMRFFLDFAADELNRANFDNLVHFTHGRIIV